jgi:hypothetical protein
LQLLVSLHDVTPYHQARLARAEDLLAGAGVTHVAYLVVPDFHRRHPVHLDASFAAWCAGARPYRVEWVLHGYDHLDPGAHVRARGWRTSVRRHLLTGGEGEFLLLSMAEQRHRVRRGLAAVRAIGLEPTAFVPPAWLANDALAATLRDAGLRFTETHTAIVDVGSGRSVACPVISWATRTLVRRLGARLVCPTLARLTRARAIVRVAIHPHDLDYVRTASQVRRVLGQLLRDRVCGSYDSAFEAASSAAGRGSSARAR